MVGLNQLIIFCAQNEEQNEEHAQGKQSRKALQAEARNWFINDFLAAMAIMTV